MFAKTLTKLSFELLKNVQSTANNANEVVMRRSYSMFTGTMTAEEAHQMVCEKPLAFSRSAHSATMAIISGNGPLRVAGQAIAPIQYETEQNVRRLRT